MARDRPGILLVHDEPAYLDRLTRTFEARGFEVAVAATRFGAVSKLESRPEGDDFDVVVADWHAVGGLGEHVYRWALDNRYHLRGRFVFIAGDPPGNFDDIVQGRCVMVGPGDLEEIVRVAEATARRVAKIAELDDADLEWFDLDTPQLLIADDEPLQLSYMSRMFRDVGFAVTTADSGNAAIKMLEAESFDVIIVDWFMPNGSGADLYRWLEANKPGHVSRVIFLSGLVGAEVDQIRKQAPSCTVLPKGQDSQALVRVVVSTAKLSRMP